MTKNESDSIRFMLQRASVTQAEGHLTVGKHYCQDIQTEALPKVTLVNPLRSTCHLQCLLRLHSTLHHVLCMLHHQWSWRSNGKHEKCLRSGFCDSFSSKTLQWHTYCRYAINPRGENSRFCNVILDTKQMIGYFNAVR
jgi:hypothetical protein